MALLPQDIRDQLLENGKAQRKVRGTANEHDFNPVVKLFTPDPSATWLLTELDPNDPDIAFGLCDLGMGFPELGSVRISEIESVRGSLNLPVERDLHFKADKPLSQYAKLAHEHQRIIT